MNLMLFLTSLIFYSSIIRVHVLFICMLVGSVSRFVRITRVCGIESTASFGVRISFVGISRSVF